MLNFIRFKLGAFKTIERTIEYRGLLTSLIKSAPMAEKSKISQPAWSQPTGTEVPQLKLYNSLTRQKELFVPQDGRKVTWYSCGPTVYDASHMGHARTYISIDVLRRVLKGYFKYDVFYVMNVTDIDDKIIKRARQNHLFEEFATEDMSMEDTIAKCQQAHEKLKVKLKKEEDKDKQKMLERMLTRSDEALKKAAAQRKDGGVDPKEARQALLSETRDLLADLLDAESGHGVNDNSLFAELPRFWEQKFHEDMTDLNILPADVLTRVTDYVPEIVDFIQKIIDNGFGYESNGSVYFNTSRFATNSNHSYAKLVPEAFGDLKSLHEGEGDLSISDERLKEKSSQSDFALWKASKPGEPSWDSPWGKGRPGWHIECSVMASSILGRSMDIHTGGFDLRFPHHDNELAQSEAYFDNDNWVRYFLHTGHLTIEGCKMSKSLKNFISIQDALEKYSSRQIRFLFLLHGWNATLDYSTKTMDIAKHYDKMFSEFFLNVKALTRINPTTGIKGFNKWTDKEVNLNKKFIESKEQIHEALCDNIDTRRTMEVMQELVGACNVYSTERGRNYADTVLLSDVARYLTQMLQMFGAIEKPAEIGYTRAGDGAVNSDELVIPYVQAFANFRQSVRQQAREIKATDILKQCDDVRDNVLPQLGVRLEDIEGGIPVVKLVDKDELMAEREAKLKAEEAKRLEKERRKGEQLRAQQEKEAQKRIPPSELFKKDIDKYSQFDSKGVPTHDVKGEELGKSARKKLMKAYEAQEKKYQDYQKSLDRTDCDN